MRNGMSAGGKCTIIKITVQVMTEDHVPHQQYHYSLKGMPRSPQVHGTPNIIRSTVEWLKLAPDVILKRNPPPYYQAWDWHDKGLAYCRGGVAYSTLNGVMSGKMGLRERLATDGMDCGLANCD